MSEAISWSLSAGGTSGSSIQASGEYKGDGIVSVSVDLEAGSAERELTLQVDDVEKVGFVAISSNLIDGKVTVKGDKGDASALTGPMLLFGAAVKLFADDLTTLTVHNTSTDHAAKLSVLVGLTV